MILSVRRHPRPPGHVPLPALLCLIAAGAATGGAHGATPAAAQDVLDRPPNVSGGWVGIPWMLHVDVPNRFDDGLHTATFTGVLGLPHASAAGLSWAPMSPTVPGEGEELEAFVRHAFNSPGDLAVTVAWNAAAESLDAETSLTRWVGPLRVLAAGRWFSAPRGVRDDRFAAAAGVVWQPLAGRAPLALAADIAAPVDLSEAEEPAWSAGLQAGIPYTAVTVSLQVSNTPTTTLQGATLATGGTRLGFEFTAPIPAGFFLGRYPSRSAAMSSVAEEPGEPATTVVEIRRYAYGPARIVVEAGTVVEWVNRDDVVHTATAEDGAWDSGGIRPGESWRARFDRPGTYPYLCSPHPFMKAVVVVR